MLSFTSIDNLSYDRFSILFGEMIIALSFERVFTHSEYIPKAYLPCAMTSEVSRIELSKHVPSIKQFQDLNIMKEE